MTDPETHAAPTPLQPLTYPEVGICTIRDLYMRLERAAGFSYADRRIDFGNGGSAKFDTYFNLFSLGKWQRYCDLKDIRLMLEGEGRFEVSISQTPPEVSTAEQFETIRKALSRARGEETFGRIYSEVLTLVPGQPLEVDLSGMPTLARGGLLYFQLRALGSGSLTGGGWATRQPPRRTPDLALSITTFRREDAVRRSVARFRRFIETSPLRENIRLIVVDNGKSAGLETDDRVTPVDNENLGGAGGFTRGLLEAKAAGASHCLFMDDDATIHMETLERTWRFLAYATAGSTAVVGALSKGSENWLLWENGATFQSVCRRRHGDLDLRDINALVRLEAESFGFPRNFYGGWWFFAFPLDHVDHLPFPFFVRGDDVSFAITHRFRMATLPGVITFQDADFSDKSTPLTEYLDLRSHMAHHLSVPEMDIGRLGTLKIAVRFFARSMCFCRYDTLEALNLAIEDVMAGPDFFAENADLAQRRADIKELTRTEVYTEHKGPLPQVTPMSGNARRPLVGVMKYTLNGHLLPFFKWFGRSHVLLASERGQLSRVWAASRITHIDRNDHTINVVHHSKARALRPSLRMLRNAWRFLRSYDALKKDWQDGYKRITTEDFWSRKLKLGVTSESDAG